MGTNLDIRKEELIPLRAAAQMVGRNPKTLRRWDRDGSLKALRDYRGWLYFRPEDLAIVNCAVKIVINDGKCEDVRIALGAVAPTPVRAKKVEEALRGREPSPKVIEEAIEMVTEDIAPRTKLEYKVYTSKTLIKRLINETITRLGG